METKVQTAYGEMTIPELVRYYEMWRAMMIKHNENKNKYNQTDEGREKNRERAREYYDRNRDKVLEKRRAKREEEKSKPMFLD